MRYDTYMNTAITRLTANNLAQMRQLNELFADVFEDPQSYRSAAPDDAYLANVLSDPNTIVLVAKQDDHVVGGLVAYCLSKLEQHRKEVFLYDLAVTSSMQRQGIGKRLVEQLRAVAKELGAYVVFVQADEGDDAVEFYQSLKPSEDISTRSFDFTV